MLGALRLLPQFRLLIGRQGVGGWGAARLAYYAQSTCESGELNAPPALKFIHVTTLRVIAMHARFLFWISVVC
jgi:hypothetical protein